MPTKAEKKQVTVQFFDGDIPATEPVTVEFLQRPDGYWENTAEIEAPILPPCFGNKPSDWLERLDIRCLEKPRND